MGREPLTVSEWSPPEIVEAAVPEDARLWVPSLTPGVWMRPLMFDTVRGAWTNVVRIDMHGFVSRHAHPSPVHGYVIKGRWHYAERDWAALEGSYVFEAPGDIHTLMGDGFSETLFWITGTLIELNEAGAPIGYADVFARIKQAAAHFEQVGLGKDYVRRFIR